MSAYHSHVKQRNKANICPNCDEILDRSENYCHKCGQENHDLNRPLGELLEELLGGLFHFETKFWNTVKVLFTRPGLITLHFFDGKRARYMAPLRLYFFMSVIMFVLIGKTIGMMDASRAEKVLKPKKRELHRLFQKDTIDIVAEMSWLGVDENDSIQKKLKPLSDKERKATLLALNYQIINDSLRKYQDSLKISETTLKEIDVALRDSTKFDSTRKAIWTRRRGIRIATFDKNIAFVAFKDKAIDKTLAKKLPYMSDKDLDSLFVARNMYPTDSQTVPKVFVPVAKAVMRKFLVQQGKYTTMFGDSGADTAEDSNVSEARVFLDALTNNIPTLMFVLMPLVALMLKLYYHHIDLRIVVLFMKLVRMFSPKKLKEKLTKIIDKRRQIIRNPSKQKMYFQHLIFSIHFHTAIFLFLSFFLGIILILNWYDHNLWNKYEWMKPLTTTYFPLFTLALLLIYLFISLRVVYKQTWLKTSVKFILLMIGYCVLAGGAFAILIFYTAFTF